MDLILKLAAVIGAAMPLPDFTNTVLSLEWWTKLGPSAMAFVASLAKQIKAKGYAEIALPNGDVVTLSRQADGTFAWSDDACCKLCAAIPESDKPGKIDWAKLLEKLLPLIVTIVPMFLDNEPTPTPKPVDVV